MSAEKRPGEGRSPVGRQARRTQHTPTGYTPSRTEYLLAELVDGRWPGRQIPRLVLERVVALAAIRHGDQRQAIAAIVDPEAILDYETRLIFEAAVAAGPDADIYHAACERLSAAGLDRTPLDIMVAGADLAFLAGAVWQLAVAELARRIEVDRVRDAATAAVVSLDAGADPAHVAERLVQRVVSADA